jgi:hypothetical protein
LPDTLRGSALLLGRIRSDGGWRGDPAVRQGARLKLTGGAAPRDSEAQERFRRVARWNSEPRRLRLNPHLPEPDFLGPFMLLRWRGRDTAK